MSLPSREKPKWSEPTRIHCAGCKKHLGYAIWGDEHPIPVFWVCEMCNPPWGGLVDVREESYGDDCQELWETDA